MDRSLDSGQIRQPHGTCGTRCFREHAAEFRRKSAESGEKSLSGLRDPQRERFATLIGSGQVQNPTDAYRMAFDKKRETRDTSERKAEELLMDPDVRIRIGEVQDEVARRMVDTTVQNETWLLEQTRVAIEGALQRKAYMAALKGVELAGKHKAMQLFPHKVDHTHRKDPLAGKSREELLEIARQRGYLPSEPEKIVEGEVLSSEPDDETPETLQ